MPKVTVPSLPMSGLFGLIKPSGPTSMSLLNRMQPLLSKSKLFVDFEKAEQLKDAPKSRKRRKRGGDVKVGQGGTLDPLADGVMGTFLVVWLHQMLVLIFIFSSWSGQSYEAVDPILRLHQSTSFGDVDSMLLKMCRNTVQLACWVARQTRMIAKGTGSALHHGSMSQSSKWKRH